MSIEFGNEVMSNAMDNMFLMEGRGEETPFFYKTIENIPTLPAAIGNLGRRGSNTILRGGHSPQSPVMQKGFFRQAISNQNYFNPLNWSRYRSDEYFAGGATGGRAGKLGYTPYGFSPIMNRLAASVEKGETRTGRRLAKMMGEKRAAAFGGSELFTGGFYSRVSTAARIGSMSEARFARLTSAPGANLPGFLMRAGFSEAQSNLAISGGRHMTQGALMMAGQGRATAWMGGALTRAMTPMTKQQLTGLGVSESAHKGFGRIERMGRSIGMAPGQEMTYKNVAAATSKAARAATGAGATGKVVAKGAGIAGIRTAGMAIPYVNVAMTAWLAYDLAKLGVQAPAYGAKTAWEAGRSMTRNLSQPIGGAIYNDTEAAATSRSRGVAAIQNSRLNARSVLGAEGGMMARHYG